MAPSRHSPDIEKQSYSSQDGLDSSQLSQFHKNGYLIIPAFLSPTSVEKAMKETENMLSTFSLDDHPMTKFSTGEGPDSEHVGDDYFLTSGDKVRFFFEEGAFDTSGKLSKPKHRAINKIGHSLHTLSPPFRDITLSKRTAAIASSLGFQSPEVLQSMIICKQPEIGGAVPPHQDSTFLYTRSPSAVGFWIALEDATIENGCLSFAAGSHLREPVRKRFVRKKAGGTGFEDVGSGPSERFPRDALHYKEEDWVIEENYELGEVKAGDLVLIHGNLLHKSEKNLSDKSRYIYTFHVIEGGAGWEYDEKNWLQPVTGKGFTKLFGENKAQEVNRLWKDW